MRTSKDNASDRRKLALIIGNDNYRKSTNGLNHSIKNVNSLHRAVKKIGFEVEVHRDPHTQLMELIGNFVQKVKDGDLVLFYYSGHGCQVNGKNFLIPVDDTSIETEMDIEDIACNVNHVLDRLVEKNPSYITLVILDCCIPYRLKHVSTATRE